MKKIVLYIAISLTISMPSFSQDENSKSVLTKMDSLIKKIDFKHSINVIKTDEDKIIIAYVDTNTYKVLEVFNVRENNPFIKNVEIKNSNGNIYNIKNTPLDYFIPKENRTFYDWNAMNENINVHGLIVGELIFNELSNAIAIGYNVTYYNEDEALGTNALISIFNDHGETIKKTNLIDGFNDFVISQNRKYLTYIFGVADEYKNLIAHGYKIINLSNDSVIMSEKINEPFFNTLGLKAIYDKVCVVINCTDSSKFLLYDLDKRICYSKKYSRIELGYFKEFTNDGLVFYSKNKSIRTDNYANFNKSRY